uniref:Uncharacterized protein n=1 Tax=Avena sativa TaxID=4498 RepID=A0ACD5XZ07_AVESA
MVRGPLVYLAAMLCSELLRISQDEFGFSSHGRITLPFDASAMEYVMCLIRREASKEVGKAFLSSIARPCHSASCVASMRLNQQISVCS